MLWVHSSLRRVSDVEKDKYSRLLCSDCQLPHIGLDSDGERLVVGALGSGTFEQRFSARSRVRDTWSSSLLG
jgi:hypothetical protein